MVCINAFIGAVCGAVRCGAMRGAVQSHTMWMVAAQHMPNSRHAGLFARVAAGRAAKAQGEWQRRPLQRGGVHWERTWRAVEADAMPAEQKRLEFH